MESLGESEDNRPPARPSEPLPSQESFASKAARIEAGSTRRIPWFWLTLSALTLWWLAASLIGRSSNYSSRLANFEASYGVNSSNIGGCWSERGGLPVNTCASRAEASQVEWVAPLTLFIFVSLWAAFKYFSKPPKAKIISEQNSTAPAASGITDAPAQDGPLVVNPRTRSSAICASCGFELSANSQCSSCNS